MVNVAVNVSCFLYYDDQSLCCFCCIFNKSNKLLAVVHILILFSIINRTFKNHVCQGYLYNNTSILKAI